MVFRGRRPGIYNSWRICQDQVTGYPHNCYHGFPTYEQALEECNHYFGQHEYNHFLPHQAMADQALLAPGVAIVEMALAEEAQQARRSWLKDLIIVALIVVVLKLVFLEFEYDRL